jgi:hypothetical protein
MCFRINSAKVRHRKKPILLFEGMGREIFQHSILFVFLEAKALS